MGDYEALAKGLKRNYGKQIHDRQSFNTMLKKYLGSDYEGDIDSLSNDVWGSTKNYDGYADTYHLKHESLEIREAEQLEKEPTSKKSAKNTSVKNPELFKFIGYQKNKHGTERAVNVRNIYVNTKYGKQIRFISANGKYARVTESERKLMKVKG